MTITARFVARIVAYRIHIKQLPAFKSSSNCSRFNNSFSLLPPARLSTNLLQTLCQNGENVRKIIKRLFLIEEHSIKHSIIDQLICRKSCITGIVKQDIDLYRSICGACANDDWQSRRMEMSSDATSWFVESNRIIQNASESFRFFFFWGIQTTNERGIRSD